MQFKQTTLTTTITGPGPCITRVTQTAQIVLINALAA